MDLLLAGGALGLLALLAGGAIVSHRLDRAPSAPSAPSAPPAVPAQAGPAAWKRPHVPPEVPVAFGYKCAWLAIKDVDPATVIEVLGITDVAPSGWQDGLDAAYRGDCFVSPSVDGWVLVVSTALPSMGDDRHPNVIVGEIQALSEELDTQVMYFFTHRVVDYHAWAWAERGRVRRAYGYDGGTLADEGALTAVELSLGLDVATAPFSETDFDNESNLDRAYPNESHVVAIAAAWSVDTLALGANDRPVGLGFLGRLRRAEP